ncbi:hypothetical protein [Homoserinibacter sp. GY 40078]|uniref:hypothetical protein n=1 Tax=Homoserinibacter sp. GY 40078 TaxID=2603275 RepID=UPI0011C9301E|nr:hypothetical protein [Homoserinibacter sp. GY 40078]TXK17264.1 hypothetical protein FVQ89_10450 [Homoserinibacter sp. GY 40078]
MSAPANPILATSLKWGGAFALALLVVASGLGYLFAGLPGLWGGLLGAALAAIFLGLTAGSIILGQRLTVDDPASPLFFGVVLGAWLVKLVVFFVVLLWLRGQPWLDPWAFFLAVIAAVLGSLAIDVLAFQRSRMPYVDVELPDERPPDK